MSTDHIHVGSTKSFRDGWDRVFSEYRPVTICWACHTHTPGNVNKCPECGCIWLDKVYPNGQYVPVNDALDR